ncbi:ABC transporter permease [Croceivirga radicis]|uniref:ABC transporter permease n=1 Tax=Croceivirga radicis TaxID=1929488 RepID=A0A1V6LPQ6_9FLAO|nr:ABC transporter permease [Croceivirga radicis]OQD42007.1 ABC transporter permease [Croceivirga radicis]
MSKLGLIIKREYLAKVRNKSFVIMTFLSPILMVGMIVLIAYLTKVNDSESRTIAILNQSDYFSNAFTPTESISYVSFKDITLEEAKDSTQSLDYYALLHIPKEDSLEETAESTFLYAKDNPNSSVLNRLEGIFEQRLRQARLQDLGISKKQFATVDTKFQMHAGTFKGEENLKGINELKAIIGGGFGYLIMMFIIIYGGFVMRSVIEEKTSRIIEVIISSVKPFQLMLGKIIGTSLAGITQFTIWIISASMLLFVALLLLNIDLATLTQGQPLGPGAMAGMGDFADAKNQKMLLYAAEFFKIPWVLIVVSFLIYFVLGYLIYSSIYAAIGAAVDNETDTQQFIFPIILPLMLAIYVGFFSVFSNPHGPIAVGFSLFPLTSPIVMLMRIPGGLGEGGVPIWQFVTSIILLILTFLAIVWLAAKIYRVGILMYGKKPTYKELFKWLKYK